MGIASVAAQLPRSRNSGPNSSSAARHSGLGTYISSELGKVSYCVAGKTNDFLSHVSTSFELKAYTSPCFYPIPWRGYYALSCVLQRPGHTSGSSFLSYVQHEFLRQYALDQQWRVANNPLPARTK